MSRAAEADGTVAALEIRILGQELGLEPGPELRRVQEPILSQDPAIAPIPVGVDVLA